MGKSKNKYLLRAIHIRLYVNFMKARGFDIDSVLAGSRIRADRLSDSAYLIDISQCHAVAANMLALIGKGGVGLEVGMATNLSDLGVIGYAMTSSSTLRQAINLWMRYGISAVGYPFTLAFVPPSRARTAWGVTASPIGYSNSLFRFYVEETFAMGCKFVESLNGRRPSYSQITLSYPPPPYWKDYKKYFGCNPIFNAPLTEAFINTPALDDPLKPGDSDVGELCLQHCTRLARRVNFNHEVSLHLREVLTRSGVILDLEQAAAKMNMSARTLRRHLLNEGTNFQKVLDDFRSDLACEYLKSGVMTLKEIASLLGFSSSNGLCRAFKEWTGVTPGTFQSNPPRKSGSARR